MDSSLQPKLAEIEAAIAGLSEQELRAAAPDKWSIAEILEHLSITYVTSMKGVMSKVLAAGPRASRPRLKQRVTTFLVTGIGYFPQGRQAPEFTLPKGRATSDVLADIRSALPCRRSADGIADRLPPISWNHAGCCRRRSRLRLRVADIHAAECRARAATCRSLSSDPPACCAIVPASVWLPRLRQLSAQLP